MTMKNKQKQYKQAKNSLQQEFIDYARNYTGSFTCLKDMARWMEGRPAFDDVSGVYEFEKVMRGHQDFEERELYKVDHAYRFFLERRMIKIQLMIPSNKP